MKIEKLAKTEQWKWAKVAAKGRGTQPILDFVNVRPTGLDAADGFRMRSVAMETGLRGVFHRSDLTPPAQEDAKFPDVTQLFDPANIVASFEFANLDAVRSFVFELRDEYKRVSSRFMPEWRPSPCIQLWRDGDQVAIRGRTQDVLNTKRGERSPLIYTETQRFSVEWIEDADFRYALDPRYLADALAGDLGQLQVEILGEHLPSRFSRSDRLEVVMPIYLEWDADTDATN